MKQTFIHSTQKPIANLAIAKNQIKNYNGSYYLKNNQEFEIELFNPTSEQILAEIELNGKLLGTGIVLRPAERVFLDCIPDTDSSKRNKFKFETYIVDNNDLTKQITSDNGKLVIRFYKELEVIRKKIYEYIQVEKIYVPWIPYQPYQPYWYSNPLIGGTSPFTAGINTTATYNSGNVNCSITTSQGNQTIETGRIGKSQEVSKQDFDKVNAEWQSLSFHTIEMKILPESRMDDLTINKIREYCTECGVRVRKSSWKFCPNCSNRL